MFNACSDTGRGGRNFVMTVKNATEMNFHSGGETGVLAVFPR
jgi:hypothetical protein